MRLLRINGSDMNIDEQTAIGIDYQAYDVKEVGKRFINISNTFSIPRTNHNLLVFGNIQDPQSLSTLVYDQAVCNYWVDNEQLIKDSKLRVESIGERINLFLFEKEDIWDLIKTVLWSDFVEDYINWLKTQEGLPSISNPYTGTSLGFIAPLVNGSDNHLILPLYMGNLYNYIPDGETDYLEDELNVHLKSYNSTDGTGEGGHVCFYFKSMFEYLEYKYDVNFLTQEIGINGNIWDDPYASVMYEPAREISIKFSGTPASCTMYYEYVNNRPFLPFKEQRDKADKTLHDVVNSFFQHFNIIKDNIILDDGSDAMRLARFDDLETLAIVKDWSKRLSGVSEFKPIIEGYTQTNLIKFTEVFTEGDSLLNSKVLESENKNLNAESTLFEIDAYVCSFLPLGAEVIPNLSVQESFKTFTFLISDDYAIPNINVKYADESTGGIITLANLRMQKAALYNLDSEYNFLNDIITHPKVYTTRKWLTVSEMKNFEFFAQYYIRELNASFFVNKIVGFNPDKSLEPTLIELIKISDKSIYDPLDPNYWVDGIQDIWTDGVGDYYY